MALARGMKNRIEPEIKKAIDAGRLLIVTPFGKDVKRVTVETAEQRNSFMIDLAEDITNNPMQKLYAQVALGSDEFIAGLKKILKKDHTYGISNRRLLNSISNPGTIMRITAEEFNVTEDQLKAKGVHRNAAIYLVKRYSGLGNNEVGELFGGMHYTAVSRLCSRFYEQLGSNKNLEKKIAAILSRIKA